MTTKKCKFYCIECFANEAAECICERTEGYDPKTGYPIVSITDTEWDYITSTTDRSKTEET